VFTATITDAFGAPVSGVVLQPSLSSTSANYSATPLATVTTDAAGKVTVTITDALAIAAGTDKLTFAAVDGTSLTGTSNPATITYAATAPAVTALVAYYSATPSTADISVVTAVPTTGIYVDGVSTKFPIQKGRNTAIANSKADGVDQLIVRVNAGAIGARVSATASAGAYILNSANLQTSSRSFYSTTTGFAGD
jgi:5-hydroxyisourate hydrolase-like protein (transthyretin family)